MVRIVLGFLIAALFAGCQMHSDDGLRTVPVTNNPHIIIDSNRNTAMPGMNY